MRWLLALTIWFYASHAQAGAWPRDQGSFFIALSADQIGSQIYAEYGMRGGWTLGTEVTMPRGRRLPDVSQFVQRHIWQKGPQTLSVGAAVELRETTAVLAFAALKGTSETVVRAGVFWGAGFASRFGDGWATMDAQVEKLVTTDWLGEGLTYKLDVGVGVKPLDRLKLIAQAQLWRRANTQNLRLETSAAWAVGPAQLVFAPSVGVIGPKAPRLRLGLWLEF